jgi:diguanylate cyclase (GGDEF)-like protein
VPLQFHPYNVPLAIAAAVALAVAVFAWQRRPAPGAAPLTLLNLALAEWAGTYAVQWSTTTLAAQVFWLSATFVGVVVAVPALFVFSLQYTHREAWLTPRRRLLLAIHPLVTLLLLATDSLHHLFYAQLQLDTSSGYVVLDWERGPWFWLTTSYMYVLLVAVVVMLVQAVWRSRGPYRAQAGTVLLAALFPWLANFVTQSFFRHLSELDLTPIAFSLTGVALAVALFRHRLLDLVPVGRSALIESMADGVLVIDAQNRVVDVNPAALQFMGAGGASPVGQPVDAVFGAYPQLVAQYRDVAQVQSEIQVGPEHFDLRITPLYDRQRRLTGRLIVWRNVSAHKRASAALQQANELLRRQLAEIEALQTRLREEALRDPLTGLYNRRYLADTLARELARAGREHYPVAIVLLDLDYFKSVNDAQGHAAGDQRLRRLSELLRSVTRASDLACRYGGDEFLMVLPNSRSDQAAHRAEALRQALSQGQTESSEPLPPTSLSAGVAEFPAHGSTLEAVIHAADRALYAAKAAGRNRVVVFTP